MRLARELEVPSLPTSSLTEWARCAGRVRRSGTSRGVSLRRLKPIARPPHGAKITWVFRIGLDLLANSANIHIHRTRSDIGGITPDCIEQLIAGENAAGVIRKVIQ